MTAGIIAAIIVGVTVLLLSIPLELTLRLGTGEQPGLRLAFRWFFGLVNKEFGGKKKRGEASKQADDQRRPGRKRRGVRGQALLGVLRFSEFLPDVWRLVRGIIGRVRIKSLSAELVIGLDDPADTALVVASLWTPVLLMFPSHAHAVRLQPSFDDGAVFAGQACMELRLRPIRIVPPIVRFGFSRSGRRLLGGLISGRWRRKS